MLIREGTEKDMTGVLELLKAMDGESAMDMEAVSEIWGKIKCYPYYKILIVEDEGNIIGTCCLIIIDNLGHRGARLAVVENVIVKQKNRGQGIGKFLMSHVMDLAKKERCYKLMLSSNKKRIRAHKFYQNIGFKQHGISFMVDLDQR